MLNEILQKIQELKDLGKDQSEMDLWSKLATTMTDEEQARLLKNLSEELKLIRN